MRMPPLAYTVVVLRNVAEVAALRLFNAASAVDAVAAGARTRAANAELRLAGRSALFAEQLARAGRALCRPVAGYDRALTYHCDRVDLAALGLLPAPVETVATFWAPRETA